MKIAVLAPFKEGVSKFVSVTSVMAIIPSALICSEAVAYFQEE
jgi:hypothetical protein